MACGIASIKFELRQKECPLGVWGQLGRIEIKRPPTHPIRGRTSLAFSERKKGAGGRRATGTKFFGGRWRLEGDTRWGRKGSSSRGPDVGPVFAG